MYRALLPLSAFTLVYVLWNISTKSFSVSSGWDVDWGYLLLQLLYWPAAIVAWLCGLTSLPLLFRKATRLVAAFALLLALPMVAYSLYYPKYITLKKWHHDAELKERWFRSSQTLNHLLQKYLRDHSDAINWPYGDEQIDPSGFIAYLKEYPSLPYRSYEREFQISVTDQAVETPWGAPILFGVDRNGDGYLDISGHRGSLKAGHADPWADGGFSYRVGVGCLPTQIPADIFEPGANYVGTLNDNDFQRLYDYRESELLKRR